MTVLDHFYTRRNASVLGFYSAMRSIALSRRSLASLSDAQLSDIGVTREEANREAARAPWDVTAHWQG